MHDTISDFSMTRTTGSRVNSQPMSIPAYDKKQSRNTRNTHEEVAEAVARLSKLEPSQDAFLWHGRSTPDIVTIIREFTEVSVARAFRQPAPLSLTEKDKLVLRYFEEDLWQQYGLNGVLVPDELLKECQKKLREAEHGSVTGLEVKSLQKDLVILNTIHHQRKEASNKGHLKGNWMSPKDVQPNEEMRSKGHRFWALIIGNDKYLDRPLLGCVNDAHLIKCYIKEYLGVPDKNICLLENATRKNMINSLYDLRDNKDILSGDNILIHFSGHGTSYDSSDYFTTFISKAGSIEGICPIDRGKSIPDISDRELNSILSELQAEKGNNITLFLDCCYSGGAARSLKSSMRYTPPLRANDTMLGLSAMLEAADKNPRRRLSTPLTSCDSWTGDVSGFVQLASCHDYQLAGEVDFPLGPNSSHLEPNYTTRGSELIDDDAIVSHPRGPPTQNVKGKSRPPRPGSSAPSVPQRSRRYGCFTWALINVLRSEMGRTGTYESVIASISQLNGMQPVVVGRRKGSRLWFYGEK